MTVTDLPPVHECTVEGCSYNHDTACHAGAISVTGANAGCGTFIQLGTDGGLTQNVAFVGACHRADCIHNQDLECHAEFIRVGAGADPADCLTFQRA
ncbi:DUF1540 domain-containing protein [Auraticoccus sp. F435]|uniref:DUF1540 domain-containing protein n=1 Tax=Auraticoccus cholistanensis TaxID=2656650 RepID=A0A6A9UQG4_9ACTN|nr:DUF1540 domain-containing protein [Auraticoccus cholistanensis]MVA75136.1 DUF1540 domain-containing protein [Auraticoccus cholistanensis]